MDTKDLTRWKLRIVADRLETLRLYESSRCWTGDLWYSLDELSRAAAARTDQEVEKQSDVMRDGVDAAPER